MSFMLFDVIECDNHLIMQQPFYRLSPLSKSYNDIVIVAANMTVIQCSGGSLIPFFPFLTLIAIIALNRRDAAKVDYTDRYKLAREQTNKIPTENLR